LIPLASVLAGAWTIRRSNPGMDRRTFSRNCYRMALPMLGLYLLLAIPSRQSLAVPHDADGRMGPDLLLGCLLVIGWYLLLGFAAGQFLMRSLPEHATAPGPAPSQRFTALSPLVVGAVGVALVLGCSLAAVLNDGGSKADPAHGIPPVYLSSSDDDVVDGTSSSSSFDSSDDAEVKSALRNVAVLEETYYTDHNNYAWASAALEYQEPDDIIISYDSVTSDGYCITAHKIGSDRTFTYDSSSGGLSDGDNC
jgi:hypothetical protein